MQDAWLHGKLSRSMNPSSFFIFIKVAVLLNVNNENLYGLVLAGGRSSRMGTDKAFIDYHGKPQAEFLFGVLQPHCHKVYTSCFRGQNISVKLNPLEDQFEIDSPMNGIMTAFSLHPDKAWLIVAVDMPYVDNAVITELIANRNREKVATSFYNEAEKFPEPLITLWEPKAFPLLTEFVKQGKISPREFLMKNEVQLIIPQNKRIMQNVNSREEYLTYKKQH